MKKKREEKAFTKFRSGQGKDGQADWSNASADVIREVVISITKAGGAIRFGLTRDKGAYSLGIYIGDFRDTEYLGLYGDLDEWLLEWKADVDAFRDSLESDE